MAQQSELKRFKPTANLPITKTKTIPFPTTPAIQLNKTSKTLVILRSQTIKTTITIIPKDKSN